MIIIRNARMLTACWALGLSFAAVPFPKTVWGAGEGMAGLPAITLGEIRDSVARLHDAIRSLEVRYCIIDRPAERGHRHRFAAKGRLRFRENVHFDDRFPAEVDLNHTQQYFTVATFDFFSQRQRIYEVSRDAAKEHSPWKVRADTFIDVVGWWPADDDPSTSAEDDVAVHLRFVLAHPKYVVREDVGDVDGNACYIVERPGWDRLWLDPALGFAVRRRERYDSLSGATLYRHRLTDFKMFDIPGAPQKPGIWFPTHASLEGLQGASAGSSEMRVEEVIINQVEDSLFRFVAPAGTLIFDRDTNKAQQIPGGRDLLDESVALAQRLQLINTGDDYTTVVHASPVEGIGLACILFLLGGVNLSLCLHRCRQTGSQIVH